MAVAAPACSAPGGILDKLASQRWPVANGRGVFESRGGRLPSRAGAGRSRQTFFVPLDFSQTSMEGGAPEYTEAPNGDQQYTEDPTSYEQPGYEQQEESGDAGDAITNPGDRINASKNDDDERLAFAFSPQQLCFQNGVARLSFR